MNRGYCPTCKCEHSVSAETAGKVAGTAVGILIGKAMHHSWWAPLAGALVGGVAGEVVDRTITARCPTCRAVLQQLGAALT